MITHIRTAIVHSHLTEGQEHLPTYIAEPELRVVDITNDVNKTKLCHNRSADEWRGQLTREQHIACEEIHFNVLKANGMRLREWALERYTPESGSEIVSSMDSVERLAYVKFQGQPPMLTVNHVIDGVFTPVQNRGRGYAGTLVAAVTAQLQRVADPHIRDRHGLSRVALNHSLITLWSDVGDFYRQFGFDDTIATQIRVDAPGPGALTLRTWPAGVAELDFEGSRKGVDEYKARMVHAIDTMTERDGVARTIVTPTNAVFLQLQARVYPVCEALGLGAPTVFGAATANGWVAWAFSFDYGAELNILGIYGPLDELVNLFAAAVATAGQHGLKLVMYEGSLLFVDKPTTGLFLEALRKAEIDFVYERRESSIPYYLHSGTRAHVKLEFPGKYSWY